MFGVSLPSVSCNCNCATADCTEADVSSTSRDKRQALLGEEEEEEKMAA